MPNEIYQRLAHHFDRLPGGFPPAPDGLELRILERLFTLEEANLALNLTLIPERAILVAARAGLSVEQVQPMLEKMAEKGLLLEIRREGRPPRYMASQFVVGIWEYQVNRLTPELVRDMDEYMQYLMDFNVWKKAPQLRTVPVGESIPHSGEVLAYENAAAMVEAHESFSVAPCICRQEQELIGKGCGKPMETCLQLGASDFYIRYGRGREISKTEALEILKTADKAGLVLQPGNAKETGFICCCCGDCCGVLRTAKLHPKPASVLSSSYFAVCDPDLCSLCGVCEERCQMEAISFDNYSALVDLDRCIGCGLCVTTCATEALRLQRKAEDDLPDIPQNTIAMGYKLGQARGVLGPLAVARLAAKSVMDNALKPH